MMNTEKTRELCLYVTGLSQDIERSTLYKEFGKFGNITKLFLDQVGKTFAKVYYSDNKSYGLAAAQLNNTELNWKVERWGYLNSPVSRRSRSSNSSNMAGYDDFYEDEFSENFDYCNVHGQPLVVLQADSGDLFVNLKDIRTTGFALFRRDTFNSVLVDKRQISKEFDLHLLSEAKNYILKNKVAVIDEEKILKTIERCKNKLLGESSSSENKHNFGDGRSVAQSSGKNIVITSETASSLNKNTCESTVLQRPPKTLPENFMPTNSQRNTNIGHKRQEEKGSRNKYNSSFNQDDRRSNDRFDFSDRGGKTNGYKHPNQNRHYNKTEIQNQKPSLETKIRSRAYDESQKETNKMENMSSPKRKDIENITFEVGNTYAVQAVYMEKESIYWVQQIKDMTILEEMFIQINEMESTLKCIDPVNQQLVLASFEGAWNRGRIISVMPLNVHFIDYGNENEVDSVKALPDCFKKIPSLAVKVKVDNNSELNLFEPINIKVKQQDSDGTYLVAISNQNSKDEHKKSNIHEVTANPKTATPSEKSYFRSSLSERTLKSNDMVIIADIEDNKFHLKTKECVQRSKEIVEHIKKLDKADLMLTNVKVDQMVLCAKDSLIGLFRAVVTKIEGSVVLVKYIDVSGEDSLPLKCLQNVDDFLASEAPCLIISPEYKLLTDLNDNMLEYLANVIEKKEKFTVVIEEEFDLFSADTSKLSEILIKLKNPIKADTTSTIPSTSTPISQIHTDGTKLEVKSNSGNDKVLYEGMDWIQVEPGTHTCMCYGFKDLNDFTVILASDETVTHIEKISTLDIQDDVPYKPEEFEMCLATFTGPDDDEANWYRAAVLEIDNDDYVVSFVDFGNQEIIKCKDIRKFPVDLKEIPILGMSCKFAGLPDKPEIVNRLKELLPDGEQLEINIKGINDGIKYQIEIPTIYKKLKSEGLY